MKKYKQLDLILEFFKKHPNKNISHIKSVDWITKEWRKLTGKVIRDPDRGIRTLHERGFLIKVRKGIYRYDPKKVKYKSDKGFTQYQKKLILKRDKYKCVICGKGEVNGIELHVDHIKPKDIGGEAEIYNGQTLCSKHNFIKKNLNQTETGKKMFIRLYKLAKKKKNKKLKEFCYDILKTYENYDINGHIKWNK